MPEPKPVAKPKQLFVEGKSAEVFFTALLHNMGLVGDVQIQDFGGINELPGFLQAIRNAPSTQGRLVPDIASVGIIRDAESGRPADAFRSVCGALQRIGLTPPSQIREFEGNDPRIGVFILPDSATEGMLEDLCLRSIADDPVVQCIDEYFDCVDEQLGSLPGNIAKAKVQAFLASRHEYVAHLGLAAHRGYWPLDNSEFDQIKQFLREL